MLVNGGNEEAKMRYRQLPKIWSAKEILGIALCMAILYRYIAMLFFIIETLKGLG